jgi:hypothetical protein
LSQEKEKPLIKVRPTEYEAKGLFLTNLLDQNFAKNLRTDIGEFYVVNLTLFAEKNHDVIMFWHKAPEDSKKGIVTITCRDEDIKAALFKALGGVET